MRLKRLYVVRAALLLGLSLWAGPLLAQFSVIPSTNQLVTDQAALLSSAEERQLTVRLADFARETSTQIVIVTLPDLDGADIGQYATELGEAWGIGQAEHDNGVVVLVSRDDRKVFIATGWGLEGVLPDAVAARIVRNVIVPNFRQNNFYGGLSQAVDAIMAAARGEDFGPPEAENPITTLVDGRWVKILFFILIWVFILSGFGGGGGKGKRRRRKRGGAESLAEAIFWGSVLSGGNRSGGGGSFGGGFGGGGFGGFGGGGFGGGGAGGSW